jgi:hypothetical protein
MKPINHLPPRRVLMGLAFGLVLGSLCATAARADMYRPGAPVAGGVPAPSTITTTTVQGNNTTVNWYGMQGWYTVEVANSLLGPWTGVGTTAASDFAWGLTVNNLGITNFTRLNQNNSYAGSGACAGCHGDKYDEYTGTKHAGAYNSATSAATFPLISRTVGYGQPSGFSNILSTPHLANVGCENCHGPAGWHKFSDHELIRPAVSIDPAICGGCHSGTQHPTYEEYSSSLHSQVNDDVKYGFNNGTYYTNTVVVSGKTLYGYYVTTNADLTLKTNATTGIISSAFGPANNPLYDAGQDRAASCGICHSGAARMAMLSDYEARLAGVTNALAMPSGKDAGAWGPTCAVCHDPHANYNTAQLRNPTWSSNYFTMPTTTDKRNLYKTNFLGVVSTNVAFMGTTFASFYNPNVNICGQCHNTRGARWDGLAYGLLTNTVVGAAVTNTAYVDILTNVVFTQIFTNILGTAYLTNSYTNTYVIGRAATNVVIIPTNQLVSVGLTTNVTGYSRPPHSSVQYNMLIGILQPDYLNTTNGKTVYTNGPINNGMGIYAAHSGIAPRSVFNTNQCATCHVPQYRVDANNNILGHSFEMDDQGCALGGCHTSGYPDYLGTQAKTSHNITRMVDLLNRWATNNAPAILGLTDYNKSKQNSWEFTTPGVLAGITNAGPAATNQTKLPDVIRQARFNLYMVRNDGSLGVHNPTFTPLLLKDTEAKILSQFATAKFTANSPDVAINGTVTFTNLNSAVTAATWDFGDGGTTNTISKTVSHKYASAGTYSVALTATDSNGTETLTRNGYITAYDLVVPSFTATPTSGSVPLTVSFTNTSLNAEYGKWSFYNNASNLASSNRVFGVSGMVVSYTYTNTGNFAVVMQASNPGGSASTTNIITVTP